MEGIFAADAAVSGAFRNQYKALPLLRAYGAEDVAEAKLGGRTKAYLGSARRVWGKRSVLVLPMTLLTYLPTLAMFGVSAYLASKGAMTLSELLSITVLLFGLDSDLGGVPSLLMQLRADRAAAKRWLGLVETARISGAEGACAAEVCEAVRFEHVSAGYDGRQALRDVSFSVARGSGLRSSGLPDRVNPRC